VLAVAAWLAPAGARALTVTSFGPDRWGAPDASLGFVAPIVEDFEDTALAIGFRYEVFGTMPPGPGPVAALPATFVPSSDPFGKAFAMGAWDGSRVLIDTIDNQSHPYTDPSAWGGVTFTFAGGVTRVGFSLTDMEQPNALIVDGVRLGGIGQIPGTTNLHIASSVRNGYLVVTADPGQRIYTVGIDNGGDGDGWAIDHLVFERAPGAAAAMFVTDDLADAVYRYAIAPGGMARLETKITAASANSVALRAGELFVADFAGGGIHRLLSPFGIGQPNGRISGVGLSWPEQIRFVGDELWVANSDLAGSSSAFGIVRLAFDRAGVASVAGMLTEGLTGANRGMLWDPASGDVFVSQCCTANGIQHFHLDAGVYTRGVPITGNGLANPHGMVITAWGELLVANYNGSTVSRFTFDAKRNALAAGQFRGNGVTRPVGLSLAPWGELYVSNQDTGMVSRFTFDSARAAVPNGTFQTPATGATRLGWTEIVPLAVGCAPPTAPACLPAPNADGGVDAAGEAGVATDAGDAGSTPDARADARGDAAADRAPDAGGGGAGGGCGCRTPGSDGGWGVGALLLGLALVLAARARREG
jgi:MYXO-CTERM domain-containing protein